VIAGVCGGLDPSLAPGDVILCRRALAPQRAPLEPDAAVFGAARRRLQREKQSFVSSALLSGNRPARGVRLKTALWNEYGAAGVDMETYPLAELAAVGGIPWLAVRAVLDPAGASLPRSVLSWRGEASERALMRKVALQPLDWPAYARLGLNLHRALRGLSQAVVPVVDAASSALAARVEVLAPVPRAVAE
jgi:nucleoside phosphorylase